MNAGSVRLGDVLLNELFNEIEIQVALGDSLFFYIFWNWFVYILLLSRRRT